MLFFSSAAALKLSTFASLLPSFCCSHFLYAKCHLIFFFPLGDLTFFFKKKVYTLFICRMTTVIPLNVHMLHKI